MVLILRKYNTWYGKDFCNVVKQYHCPQAEIWKEIATLDLNYKFDDDYY